MSTLRAPLRPTAKRLESGRPKPSAGGGGGGLGSWPHPRAPSAGQKRQPGQEWPGWSTPVAPYRLLCRLDMVLTSGSPRCLRRRQRRRPSGPRGAGQRPPTGNSASGARVLLRPAPFTCHRFSALPSGGAAGWAGQKNAGNTAPPPLPHLRGSRT